MNNVLRLYNKLFIYIEIQCKALHYCTLVNHWVNVKYDEHKQRKKWSLFIVLNFELSDVVYMLILTNVAFNVGHGTFLKLCLGISTSKYFNDTTCIIQFDIFHKLCLTFSASILGGSIVD